MSKLQFGTKFNSTIKSSSDVIDFVGAPPFLRIALRVTIATMHFHIFGLFSRTFFRIKGVPGNNLAPMKNCPWGAR